jgi:hypothetical protein
MDGFAYSEPSKVEGIDILKEIHRMLDESTRFENNVQFLNGLAKDIMIVVKELDEKAKGFFAIRENMGFPEHELGNSIATILTFNVFANTTWGIGYETTTQGAVNDKFDPDGRIKGLVDRL